MAARGGPVLFWSCRRIEVDDVDQVRTTTRCVQNVRGGCGYQRMPSDVQLKRIHGNVSAYEGGGGEV
mgnify:CR=1 FL=1